MINKRRRTNEEWVKLVNQQQASGLQAEPWCEKNGVNFYSMADAKSRIRKLGLLPPPEKNKNEKWLKLVSQQRASGLTMEAWCIENGIKLATMADRITQLRKIGLITEPRPAGGRYCERHKTTELRKCEQRQATKWVEISQTVLTPQTHDITEIQVKVGAFTIVVSENFHDETFVRVCKLLNGAIF